MPCGNEDVPGKYEIDYFLTANFRRERDDLDDITAIVQQRFYFLNFGLMYLRFKMGASFYGI